MTSTRTPAGQEPVTRPWHMRHRRALGLGAAVLSAGLAALWTVVVPDKADETHGIQSLALRYGHPASWALLTVVALYWAADGSKAVRDAAAWLALACYAAFLVGLAL